MAVDMSVSKGFLTNKIGPLPTWAWMLIGLAAAIIWAVVKENKDKAKKDQEESDGTYDYSDEIDDVLIGGNQKPPIVFQSYVTSNFLPPSSGRPTPPVAVPGPPPPGTKPPAGTPKPTPAPKPTPKPTPAPAPAGQWVTLAKWTSKNPPWNSTLWGIAEHSYGKGKGNLWPAIWNAPQNAALKARRKDPKKIQTGDKIWVPKR